MATLLEGMLSDVYLAFSTRDVQRAIAVLRADAEIDRFRNLLFIRHVENPEGEPRNESIGRRRRHEVSTTCVSGWVRHSGKGIVSHKPLG